MKPQKTSIYRIPEHIKKVNPNAFKPQLVSFGPYHHWEPHLLPMEKVKHRALLYFERCCGLSVVNEVWDMLEDLQRSYDKLDDEWKTKPAKFLELMILDGCFLIQLLLDNVVIFPLEDVQRDMLLLENQLPMKLLWRRTTCTFWYVKRLLNAMTFEKLVGIDNIVGSFVILMGNLLEKDEVDSFNQLAKGTVLSMWDVYAHIYSSVNEHCKRPWRIWWTTLKIVSFQSPWIIISALSAIIGFVLLIIQTIYGVYGYYLPR
ncbi:UPF0481 protein, partial [Cucurbita argyrosperma subsp. argyrosperma]